jgi:hypothetical protein
MQPSQQITDSIVASAKPTLSSAELVSFYYINWLDYLRYAPGDVFILEVESNDNATYLALELDILLT